MPNEQTSVPLFTTGEVLTAANMNISAGTGVPVFSNSTTRDAGFGGANEKVLAEGQLCYLSDSNIVQYYTGAAWATVGPSTSGVVQVLTAQTSVSQTSSSQTYADATSLSVTITPQSTNNKIVLSYSTTGTKSSANANNNLGIRFVRGATTIATWGDPLFTATALGLFAQQTFNYLDAPASISALTYKVQFANVNNNGASVGIQSGSSPGLLTVMEITA